jgi:glucose-1-phosphate thymidylyltransferase
MGTRMRQSEEAPELDAQQAAMADSGIKAMIPIGRPFLDYVLSGLADSGYSKACLVIGPEHKIVRDYYIRQSRPQRIDVDFAVQEKPLGTADAVAAAEPFVGADHFLVINSDNYYPAPACAALRALKGPGTALFERDALVRESNIPAERIWRYAVADIGPDGYLRKIIEKPDAQSIQFLKSPIYVSMNCWLFTPVIFDACRRIPLSTRGEREIPAAVEYAIEKLGERFKVLKFQSGVLDLTSRSDIAAVTAKLEGKEANP